MTRSIDAIFLSQFEDLDLWHNDHLGEDERHDSIQERPMFERELDDPTAKARWLRQSVSIDDKRYDLPRFLSWMHFGTTAHHMRYDTFSCTHLVGSYYRSLLGGAGYHVEHIQPMNRVRLAQVAKEVTPRYVLLSTTFLSDVQRILETCQRLRAAWPEAGLIVGGLVFKEIAGSIPKPALQYIMKSCGADAYVISAMGEEPLLEILAHEPSELADLELPATWVRRDGDYVCATGRPETPIPMDDTYVRWTRLHPDTLYHTVGARTARSCAFDCAFCSFKSLQGDHEMNSPETFERELCELRDNGAVRSILFTDDTLNVPPVRFKQMCRILKRFDFDWYSFIRVQHLDEETVRLMAESGCKAVFLGIEAADDTMLKRMGKATKMHMARKGVKMLKRAGITVHANFIIGFPGDTADNTFKIVPFMEETGVDFFGVSPWYYSPNTPIARQAQEYGLEGRFWKWRHATMDIARACELEAELLAQPKSAQFVSDLTVNTFWGASQLLANGIPPEDLKTLVRTYENLTGQNHRLEDVMALPEIGHVKSILRAHPVAELPGLSPEMTALSLN